MWRWRRNGAAYGVRHLEAESYRIMKSNEKRNMAAASGASAGGK